MTKMNNKRKVKIVKRKVQKKIPVRSAVRRVQMGAISAISTAPVAIGNSIRGAKSISRSIPGGVIVAGRDFMFQPLGTSSVTTWCMVGGTPLTPVAFGDSTVRQYLQMYQKYRWKRCVVHYITSSSTSSTGDVMFYHGKNRDSVFLNQTSNFLMPWVISDPDTVLGPQWTNHSADLSLQGTWKSTDYGMTDAINDYSDGEVYLLSKTTTTDSPGYVLFDYEIEFKEMQISPRLLALPIPRAQYTNVPLGGAVVTYTSGNGVTLTPYGNNLSGAGGAVTPSGLTNGDIYKVIFDVTNSTNFPTALSAVTFTEIGGFVNTTIQDGSTLYAIWNGSTYSLYLNTPSAYTAQSNLKFGGTTSTGVTTTIQTWMSYVGSIGTINVNPNY